MVADLGKSSEQISRSVGGINSVTQKISLATDQIARAAEDLNRQTEALQRLVAKFDLEIN